MRELLIKTNNALSGVSFNLFLIVKINCPNVKSSGTKYLFLSISQIFLHLLYLSTITGILEGYFFNISRFF